MSSKKKNSLTKANDEEVTEQVINAISTDLSNESVESTTNLDDDLKIMTIPKMLHEHFECVVGKNVFIDKPWTQISHKKILEHLQKEKSDSCFWKFRKELEAIQNEYVLVGYKAFSSTDEEFLICTTDRAEQFIKQTQVQMEREQNIERSMLRVPKPWESKCSEKDIEDIKSVSAREKITCIWKLSTERLKEEAKFEVSTSKSMKNQHVKLEPRYSKDKFECADVLTMDTCVQATRKMVNREMQTIPRIKDNKCIQSVAVEEEMFQFQPLTKSDKALDDFLDKHVPNLVDQLHYNDLYDLYRDDYKLLKNKNENENATEQNSKDINIFPGYQNTGSKNKYVSSHTWHPTIPGIFAISYTSSSNALYKSVSLETATEEVAKSIGKDMGSYSSDNDNNVEHSNDQSEVKLVDENYKEKIISLLNMEFVQRMRVIQVTEEEKSNDQYGQDIKRQLRNFFNYKPHEQIFIPRDLSVARPDDDSLNDENKIMNEIQNELSYIEILNNTDQSDESVDVDVNECKSQIKGRIKASSSTKMMPSTVEIDGGEYRDKVEHHDSDTESFYNIWGDDEEWMYGNELRNVVRNLHRKFNKKYDREARENKLFRLLKSEAEYTKMKNKIDDMETERIKLTKDMFEAGYKHQKLKNQSKKRKKSSLGQNKVIRNCEDPLMKRENVPPVYEQNSVIIWSINDNMFPKLILESSEEVYCVEFSPRNGNTVVGGLVNGQICIWDIKEKLDKIDSNNLTMSEKKKKHHRHLWMHMQWSLEVQFKTRIKPAALSAILESHESMVTAIQWIHPMNEITSLGKLVTVKEGQFSDQFFSASMDGTIKLWDLHSTPIPRSQQNIEKKTRFPYPDKLDSYKSPLSIYNNCLKPLYTIIITKPETTMHSPITALSFEIPVMQYKYTSNQPLEIGKRQFEYVPTISDDPNRILVVGSIMGDVGIVTWNGYEIHQQGQNKEECKNIWWGHVHDGPINCIKRNVFYPDLHLVCGGHVVSIWSLNYEGGPIWWKRFSDFTNSVLWSTIHPAEFRVSFNSSGVLQFWNFMKYTHQPYYESNNLNITGDGLIGSLSTPLSSIHFIDAEQLKFSEGINELLNYNKNELIGFSDSNGMIWMITISATILEKNKIEEVGNIFQKEIDRRRELDAWNIKYKEEYGPVEENEVDDSHCESTEPFEQILENDDVKLLPKSKSIKRQICHETIKWYLNRCGSKSRLTREKFTEREKRHMIETLMQKKNVNQQQLDEYIRNNEMKTSDESNVKKIRFKSDETYKHIVNKLLAAEETKEYGLDIDSQKNVESEEMKQIFEKIHNIVVTDYEFEKEKLNSYIKNNPYKAAQEDWAQVIEFAEREDKDVLNDPNILKGPNIRYMVFNCKLLL
uniref:WD repeat-containing protein 63 n=1 Tax=Sipha flava TaxID=143950 RepID=A0A2S2R2B2_9HEMI